MDSELFWSRCNTRISDGLSVSDTFNEPLPLRGFLVGSLLANEEGGCEGSALLGAGFTALLSDLTPRHEDFADL